MHSRCRKNPPLHIVMNYDSQLQYDTFLSVQPESYYHGTVNIGDTIAIGIQKKNAHLRMEMIIYEGQ